MTSEFPTGWRTLLLGDCGTWFSGGTPSRKNQAYWNGDIPWISAKSLTDFYIRDSDRRVTELGAKNGTRIAPPGSTVFVVRGMSLQSEFRVGIAMRDVAFNQDCKAIVPQEHIDPFFLAYAVRARTPLILNMVDSASHGTGRLATDRIASLQIGVPPLEEQQAIAEVLGALDDRIDHLHERVSITVECLRTWYRILEPARFEVRPVGEVFDVVGGSTPSTKVQAFWGGPHPWITPKDLSDQASPVVIASNREVTEEGLRKISSGLLPRGTVLMSSRAPIGYVSIAEVPLAVNQGFIALKPKAEMCPAYVMSWLHDALDEIKARAGGSTFAEISKRNFRPIPFPVPRGDAYEAYAEGSPDLIALIVEAEKEKARVAESRDALLPRLLSGELRVADPQRLLGAVA